MVGWEAQVKEMLWWWQCCPVELLSRCSSVTKSGQVLMPCGSLLSVFHEEQRSGWAVAFLMAGVSSAAPPPQHWFSSYNIALRNQWECSLSKEVTAHYCFQSPLQIATETAINEVGFQQDLTSVIVCSSPHHTVTPHYVLVTEALVKPDISGQGFVYHQRWVCFCHYGIPSVYVSSLCLCHSEQSPFLVNL